MSDTFHASSSRKIYCALIALGTVMLAGAIGNLATIPNIPGWYAELAKPSFNPPNWIFGPVWVAIYIWMALAASAAWDDRPARRTFFIILLVNALWSLLFFGMHRPDLALIDILAYLILLVAWIRQLWPQHRGYALLQLPHLLWVSFATVLNASIWWLNK
jgi:tryptophan-rich sensory protein